MGLISFIKDAGEKIFGKSEETLEKEKTEAIINHIKKYGINIKNLSVSVDDETVTIGGEASSILDKNKVVVIAGNVQGISTVNDNMVLNIPEPVAVEPEKQFYTVVKGDYLSKIAKRVYGDAMKYPVIFEANKPMLKDPDKIYPGQVLVIPPID